MFNPKSCIMKNRFTKLHSVFSHNLRKSLAVSLFSLVAVAISFITSEAQTNFYVQDFSTPVGLFPYPSSFNGIRSANDIYTYSSATSATYSSSSTSASILNVEALATGLSNSGTSNFFAVTTSGGNQKLLMSLFRRSQAFRFSVPTSGYTNINLAFELTLVEQSAVQFADVYLQYNDGSGFVSIPGFNFNTAGLTTLTSQNFNITLPSGFNNNPTAEFRLLAIPNAQVNSNYISIAVDNVTLSGTLMPLTKLAVTAVNPSVKYNNIDLAAIVRSVNDGGIPIPVTSNTSVVLSVASGSSIITGTTTATILAGTSSATVSGFRLTTANGVTLIATTTSGDALMTSAASASFDVLLPLPAASVKVNTSSSLVAGQSFTVELKTLSSTSTPGAVLSNTVISLVGVGATLGGNTVVTILSGLNSVSLSGVVFLSGAANATISAITVSGDALTVVPSSAINVSLPPQGWTNPIPVELPLVADFGSTSFGVLPAGFQFIRNEGTSPRFRNSIAGVEATLESEYRDRAVQSVGLGLVFTSLGVNNVNGISPLAYVNNKNAKLAFSLGTRTFANVLAVNTQGWETIKYSYDVETIENTPAVTGGIFLQYRVGNTASWSTIPSTNYVLSFTGTATGFTGTNGNKQTYTGTLPGIANGQAVVQFRWITYQSSETAASDYKTVALDNISITGTKTDYLKIVSVSPSKILAGDLVTVVVASYDRNDALKNVSLPTVISLSSEASFTGLNLTTITSGQSTATFTGISFVKGAYQTTLKTKVNSGDAFASGSSNKFNVIGIATGLKIVNVLPEGNLRANSAAVVRVKLLDADGKTALSKTNVSVSFGVTTGTGIISSTTTGLFTALQDSIISVTPVVYNKVENNVILSALATGLTAGKSDTIDFKADPNAGLTILYREDFENSTKAVLAPNGNLPALPSNMKIYNIDGNSSEEYARYGLDAFVVERRAQVGYVGKKTDNDGTTRYFDNSNSAIPDSNYIAFATSFFSLTQTVGANRWLVTPQISLTGNNLKLSFQAMSFTSSGDYGDSFKVYYSLVAPGATIISGNWIAVPGTQTYNAPTYPQMYTITLSSSFANKKVAFAWQLNTLNGVKRDGTFVTDFGGDRLALDNIAITSGGVATSTDETELEQVVLSVSPNPAVENILINSSVPSEVRIFSLSGVEVLGGKTGSPIYVGGLTKGLYIAVTKKGNVKFIVE